MADQHGEWIWFELLTDDLEAAQAFYREVVGWTAASSGMPDMDYRLFRAADGEVGGLMKRPDGMEPGPVWLGYVGVDDVDASVKAITAAGGALQMPAMDVPGVGRMAMLTDPQQIPFYVMRGDSPAPSRAFMPCADFADQASLGHTVWCELSAPDPDAALDFYRTAFGWRHDGGMPMGELGEYRFLRAGENGFGALMRTVPDGGSGWLFYVHVSDIDAAAGRVRAGGGAVLQEPVEIPGGAFSLVARDPQGAVFGLVGARP